MDLARVLVRGLVGAFNDTDEPGDSPGLPPGLPPSGKYEGPWFQTQLIISSTIGLVAFLLFSYSRTRWPVMFAPRTKLKGFSPIEAHSHQSFLAWILPTIRTSEFTILQIVGLDAAVLLSFLKMSFYLFSVCSVFAVTILMPMNYYNNGRITDPDDDGDGDWPSSRYEDPDDPSKPKGPDWPSLISDTNTIMVLHLVLTYLFTFLALRFVYQNYQRFIRSRQLYSLELAHSIAARTVMVTDLPNHLQGERALAEYFENMNLPVESVSIGRDVGSLKVLIEKRTNVLLALEKAWTDYVGNPTSVESYDPSLNVRSDATDANLIDLDTSANRLEAQPPRLVVPHRPRPTLRPSYFGKPVDALEYLQERFQEADEAVRKKRRSGKFKATHVAFVTFETMSSAQIASQVVHAPYHSQCITCPAPEPRDIVWSNMIHSPWDIRIRDIVITAVMLLLLLFWLIPITTLASLLSYKEIKKVAPWLGRLIDRSPKIQALVQTSLPSVAVVSLNGLLPFLLEGLSYEQGLRARSWIEYSLLKKYFLFLLVHVVFIFLLASTYWALVRDLANSPAKIPEKLAESLKRGTAKHFFLSYVILQGLGIMPLQLLNLGVIAPRLFYRAFITRTPRDYAELNAPPMINYGAVYPQAILVFVITLTYSIIQPLILIFGAIYFGMAYVVYKYKLLFVFYKPYESQGQAWPITFTRLMWGVVIFQIFMTGIFLLSKQIVLGTLMPPLLLFTVYWTWYIDRAFEPLSKFVSLSSVCEVQRGEGPDDVTKLKAGHPVTLSQSNLNRRRYAQNDETLYVAPEDERTDYSQPPMSNWYYGILNTGKRHYGHPALTGILPQPWLPIKKGQTLANYVEREDGDSPRANGGKKKGRGFNLLDQAVVLTLRRKPSAMRKDVRSFVGRSQSMRLPGAAAAAAVDGAVPVRENGAESDGPASIASTGSNPWREAARGRAASTSIDVPTLRPKFSFDHATGVINLPDDETWLDGVDSDSEEMLEEGPTSGEQTPGADHPPAAGPSTTAPADTAESATGTTGSSPAPERRHATYYHHPERRKSTMPGSFGPR